MIQDLEQDFHGEDLVLRILVVSRKISQICHDGEPQAFHHAQLDLLISWCGQLWLRIWTMGWICLALLEVGRDAVLGWIVTHLFEVTLVEVGALLVDEVV